MTQVLNMREHLPVDFIGEVLGNVLLLLGELLNKHTEVSASLADDRVGRFLSGRLHVDGIPPIAP